MKNKIDKRVFIIMIIGIMIGIIISISSSYVLAQTLVNSKDVYYEDNSGLAVNNVQAAIDGTCTKFSNQLQEFLLKVYPIGSIYISYNSTNPGSLFGGTWENYGNGRVLKGINSGEAGTIGGSDTVTLTTENLPAHTHDISHTHTTASTTASHSLTAQSATPVHNVVTTYYHNGVKKLTSGGNAPLITSGGDKTNNNSSTITVKGGAHTHGVAGTITIPELSTNSISKTTSGSTGSGTSFSVQNSYITVYMWRRTK